MIAVPSMNSKAKFDQQRQRFRIVNNSIYGFWSDSANTMELKISPTALYTRIKIIRVNDPAVFERLSFYCGLQFLPKRTKWKGFDFITHLVKANEYSYTDGVVHMPNATRKNLVNLTALSNSKITLDFFFIELKHKLETQSFVGSLTLIKRIP